MFPVPAFVSSTRVRWPTVAIAGLVGAYAVLVYRTAWMCDDAFISLRTAANILSGYGPRWNIAERVQTYSHPLWLGALTAAHAVTSEPFYSTLYLSWLVSCTAVVCLVFGRPGGSTERLLGLGLMLCSRAFVDYSTSGLENPLTHLLIALFAVEALDPVRSDTRYWRLAAIAGLAGCNRIDTVALLLPALAQAFPRESGRGLRALAWFAVPLLAWEAFSLFYYGFLFPNTAYAKLTTGIAGDQRRLLDSAHYFWTSIKDDPLTLGTVALSFGFAARHKDRPRLALLCGAALYLVYVFAIGGDFMAGRFFSAPFFLAVACLTSSHWLRPRTALLVAAVAAAAAATASKPLPWLTDAGYGDVDPYKAFNEYGIHDERAAFFQTCSLANADATKPADADHYWTREAHVVRAQAEHDPAARVKLWEAIGLSGYYAGPYVHIVDRWALADPLLARLPAVFGGIGHYTRTTPAGYPESLRSGKNLIADKGLAAYYDDLKSVVRGPLLSADRWRAIWNLATGKHDRAIDAYAYVRTRELRPRLRVTNITKHPNVFVYVWNDARQQSYWIDNASVAGKTYDLSWRVTESGALLEAPFGLVMLSFQGLRPRGGLTLGVAFNEADGSGLSLHELRYGYVVSNGAFTLVREPWLAMNPAFPTARWREYTTDHAIAPLALTPIGAPR